MKKQFVTLAAILCILFPFMFLSCATTVNVRLTRPANLDLNGAKTIAILPFKPYAYYLESKATSGVEVLINSFYQIFSFNDLDEQQAIDSLRSQLERGLLDSEYIQLVSADAVEKAVRKGYINPADVYLTGEVTYFDVENSKTEEKKLVKAAKDNQKAEYKIQRYWKRTVTFNFRYQVVDSSTDKVISFDEIYIKNSSAKYEAKGALPSAYSLIESDLKASARKILQNLQPYVVTKSIKLLEPKTKDKELKKRMKAADELADDNQLTKASAEFQKIYEETDLLEAGYNAAILQEAMGNLSLAEEMMMDLYNHYPDQRVSKGLSDIRYEISQANRLQKQIKKADANSSDYEDLDDLNF